MAECELQLHSCLLGSIRLGYEMKIKIIKSERHFFFFACLVPHNMLHEGESQKSSSFAMPSRPGNPAVMVAHAGFRDERRAAIKGNLHLDRHVYLI